MPSENTERIRDHAVKESADPKTRRLLLLLSIIAVLSLLAAIVAGIMAWRNEQEQADAGEKVAEQLQQICENEGQLNLRNRNLCEEAKEVAEDDPEIQDTEIDDPDPDDPEQQDPEIQDPEIPNAEDQERERQDDEQQDSEEQDGELQEDEIQDGDPNDPDPTDDPDPDDPENQDPEVDDPDPASPFVFVFTFTVPPSGFPGDEAETYRVICNSGTGNCTVEQQ